MYLLRRKCTPNWNPFKYLVGVFFGLGMFFAMSLVASAATYTWDGGGADNNFSTCANWSTNVCPTSSDGVVFDATSTKNATIDASFAGSIASLSINAGYTTGPGVGTITQSRSLTVSGNFTQADGTFSGGSASISVSGAFNLSGGSFTSTSGTFTLNGNFTHTAGTFSHNSGTFTFSGSSTHSTLDNDVGGADGTETFYNLTFSKSSGYTTYFVDNDVIVTAGTLTFSNNYQNVSISSGAPYFNPGGAVVFNASAYVFLSVKFLNNGTCTVSGSTNNFYGSITVGDGSNAPTVNLGSNFSLGNGGQDLTVANGTFNALTYTLTVADDLTLSGGAFNGGTNTMTLLDVFINGGTFTSTSGTATINGNFLHTAGSFAHNNGTVVFAGTNNATFDTDASGADSTETFYNLSFTKTTGKVTAFIDNDVIATVGTLSFSGYQYLNITSGAPYLKPGGNVTLATDAYINLQMKFLDNNSHTISGTTSYMDANITIGDGSTAPTVTLGANLTLNAGGQDLIVANGILDLAGYTLSVADAFTIASGANLKLQGGETSSTPTFSAGSIVTYYGVSGPYTLKSWTYTNPTLVINGGASTVFRLGATLSAPNLTITNGVLYLAGYTLTSTTFSNNATLRMIGSETVSGFTLDTDSGTVEIIGDADSSADSYVFPFNTFYSLSVNFTDSADGLISVPSVNINGNLTVAGGTLTAPTNLNIAGSFTRTGGTFTHNSGTVTFTGTGTINNSDSFNNLTVNSSGTVTLGAGLDVNGTLTLTAGILDVSASNYGINVAGSWTDSGAGALTEGTGTVTFDGTGTINSNESFYNVIVDTAGTATLGAVLYVGNNLTITSGTLDVSASNYGITIGGNFSRVGTFTPRAGTVTFNDATKTSVISGSTTFAGFRCVTSDKNIQFTAGTTQVIGTTFTLTGTANHLIILTSTVNDSAWYLNVSGTSSVAYVNVRDSDASSGNDVDARGTGSINSGNNLGWLFNTPPTVGVPSVAIDGSGYVTLTFLADDANDDDTLRALVEYDIGAGFVKATISENLADIDSTYGTPYVENDNAYQVGNASGYITTSSGANTISVVWDSKVDEPIADTSSARVRVTVYDGYDEGTPGVSSTFTLDNASPLGLAGFASSATTSSTITWTWAASTDTHFSHYEIWYGLTESDVINRTGTAIEWDNSDDALLATATTATTMITGLSENTTYYAKIWAIDTYGNEATLSATTANNNGRATLSGVSGAQSANANQYVTVQFTVDDSDDDNTIQVLVEYNIGSGWVKATLSESGGDITATYGTPDVENDNAYQVGNAGGYITTSSGANTITVIWRADLDVPGIDLDTAQVRATPYDGIETGAVVTSTNFVVDAVAPTAPGTFAKSGGTGTTSDMTWTVSTESHFNHYEIWYGTNSTDVNNRSGTAFEWDNSDDVNLATKIITGTTITGLTPGSTYYSKICAVDNYGYYTCTSSISFVTNQAPTTSVVNVIESANGDGDVSINFTMDDPDNDDTLQAKIEYSLDGGSTWLDPTLSTVNSETTATYGDPSVNNSATYQIGQSGAYITSSSGINTVTVVWEALTDVPSITNISNAKVKITPYDGVASGTGMESVSFVLDMVDPSGLTALLNTGSSSTAAAVLTWNPVTESNFDHYEIWYSQTQADVQNRSGSAIEWDNTDDATLAVSTTASTRITTNPSNKYFKIWAVDDFGNEQTVNDILVVFNVSNDFDIGVPSNLSVTGSAGSVLVTWSDPSNDDSKYISILRGISPYPVDGVPIATVAIGTQSFLDTGVVSGQTVTYQLRATDGSNTGDLTTAVSFTVPSDTTTTSTGTTSGSTGTSSTAGEEEEEEPQEPQEVEENSQESSEEASSFVSNIDLPEHWSTGYMKNLITEDYVVEVAVQETSFMDVLTSIILSPDDGMARADAVEFLIVLSGIDIGTVTIDTSRLAFTDVSPKLPQAGYIEFAYQAGLINGYPDGSFRPFKVLNRAEILKMCMYFFGHDADSSLRGEELLTAYGLTKNPFSDVDLEAWYAPYVIKAYSYGVVKGYPDGTFKPERLVTNAEFLKIATLSKNLEEAVTLSSELE